MLTLGRKTLSVPILQGGMGVGVSLGGLAGAVAACGGMGVHFPGQPVMPGVLILEALAQTGAVAALSLPENKGKLALFGGSCCRLLRSEQRSPPAMCSPCTVNW